MTDDEVRQWLSEDEWAEAMPIPNEPAHMRPIARTLAEARKALAAMADADEVAQGFSGSCLLCMHRHVRHSMTARDAHEPDCIFATMPRPSD